MRLSSALLFSFLASHALLAHAEATNVCVSVFEEAEQEQALLTSDLSGRGVAGAGRLYFHYAPDLRCQLKNVFVIPGDRLEAYADYGEFTRVIYWNSATGAGAAGWVLRSRLTDTRMDIASGPVPR